MRTYWLTTYLGYACRHSGACCSARWPIPIERDRAEAAWHAIEDGRVRPSVTPWLHVDGEVPSDLAGVLALGPAGACVFHSPGSNGEGGCGIHAHRPRSCEHFPYVCVIDPRGVHVTLSHYCPTAAAMLFDGDGVVDIVEGPPIFADGRVPEGLDATEALPPAFTPGTRHRAPRAAPGTLHLAPCTAPGTLHSAPGTRREVPRLMSWTDVSEWERECVRTFAADERVPEAPDPQAFERARRAVPEPWSWPGAPAELVRVWEARVAPAWPRWAGVIGRYLAAKAHASWAMHLGDGPADVIRLVALARTVLQIEAARQCAAAGSMLDAARLTQAIRQSDLLLMHLADPHALLRP